MRDWTREKKGSIQGSNLSTRHPSTAIATTKKRGTFYNSIVLHWIIRWYHSFTSQNFTSSFFKNFTLVEVTYLLIWFTRTRFFPWYTKNTRFSKTKFFLWKKKNTDGNGVNKQNKHTHTNQTLKESLTLERVSMKISDAPFLKRPSLFMEKFWTSHVF